MEDDKKAIPWYYFLGAGLVVGIAAGYYLFKKKDRADILAGAREAKKAKGEKVGPTDPPVQDVQA